MMNMIELVMLSLLVLLIIRPLAVILFDIADLILIEMLLILYIGL